MDEVRDERSRSISLVEIQRNLKTSKYSFLSPFSATNETSPLIYLKYIVTEAEIPKINALKKSPLNAKPPLFLGMLTPQSTCTLCHLVTAIGPFALQAH